MRIFWLLFDIFLVLLVCGASLFMFAWWNLASWTYDEPPLDWELPNRVYAVPMAASGLPAEHRITPDDIVLEEVELGSDLPLDLIMMTPDQIAGRVLRRPKEQGEMFLVTDLFLEGLEPGAPPESLSTPDKPWPPLEKIELLANAMAARQPEELESSTSALPVAAVDLPAGRMMRVSDVALQKMSYGHMREASFPEYEVLMSTAPIIGRRLLRSKRLGDPFLLSDFAVEGEVEAYLREHRPDFKSRTLESMATEIHTLFPPLPKPLDLPAPRVVQEEPEEHDDNGNTPDLADDPETLFGSLPADAAPKYQSATRELILMNRLARRSQPILAQGHEEFDFRDAVGTSLAPALPLGVGGTAMVSASTWFGGATLSPETYGDHEPSAIVAMPQSPTSGDYTLTLPDEVPQAGQPEERIEESQSLEYWWRKMRTPDTLRPRLEDIYP